jgi:hypothetical protein
MEGVALSRTFGSMTGPLTEAAQLEHLDDMRTAASKRRRAPAQPRGKRRKPALSGLLRPRRALAA